jgi:hypothetical protein
MSFVILPNAEVTFQTSFFYLSMWSLLNVLLTNLFCRHSLLLILNNLLHRRTLHKSLVPGMITRIILLNLESFGLVAENPRDHHIPSDEGQVCIGATKMLASPHLLFVTKP